MDNQTATAGTMADKIDKASLKSIIFSRPCCLEKYQRYCSVTPRTVILLSGTKHYFISDESGSREVVIVPGEHLYVVPFGLLAPGPLSVYEMLSIVYYPRFIRVIRLTNHRLSGPPPTDPDLVLHTDRPLTPCGIQLLQMLNTAGYAGSATALHLYRALLAETLGVLRHDAGSAVSASWHTWSRIKDFVQENLTDPELNRETAAAKFKLTPSYVSQLFARYDELSFNAYLNRERLKLAVHLFGDTEKTQQEIASLCGYRSAEYFIRVFRKIYGRTPAAFRRRPR